MDEQVGQRTEALKVALQMEVEGKEFYQRSAESSINALAKDLFTLLAEQEDVHYAKVKEIYEAVTNRHEWPGKEIVLKHERCLRSVFSQAIESMGKNATAASSELEAMRIAMKMEDQSYSFYRCRDQEATSPAEKTFYQALTAEERVHYLTLMDSYEYLSDPPGWFTKSEHWGLDGA
jgi:rubrerythrin